MTSTASMPTSPPLARHLVLGLCAATVVLAMGGCNRDRAPADADAAAATAATPAAMGATAAGTATPEPSTTPIGADAATAGHDQPEQDVPPATAQSALPASPATWSGYGAMRLGMTPAEARAAWTTGKLDGAPGKDSTCFQMRPRAATTADAAAADAGTPARPPLTLMFEDDKLVRYDVRDAAIVAPGGGQVGQDLPAVITRYGNGIQRQPHKYVDGASNLRATAPDGKSVLVLETDAAGKVIAWRVGVPPQVDYVEGCG